VPETHIADQPDAHRYVITVGGEPVGLLLYRLGENSIAFTHAEIDPDRGGQGLGSVLAAFALDDARVRGLAVLPQCPFLASYVQRHPEYVDLVPESARERFGL
jgi:predicted GNAT family acetyltransferase